LRAKAIVLQSNETRIQLLKQGLAGKKLHKLQHNFADIAILRERAREMQKCLEKKKEPVWQTIEFIALVDLLQKDIHYRSIFESDSEASKNLSPFVEFTLNYHNMIDEHAQILVTIRKTEMEFIKTFQRANEKVREIIKGNSPCVTDYNYNVRLYNRYSKNIELATSPKDEDDT